MRYDSQTHNLTPLPQSTTVMIQNKLGKWDRIGTIVEALPHRQYRIRIHGSGRVTLKNRRFIRETKSAPGIQPIPSAEESNMPTLNRAPPQEPTQQAQPQRAPHMDNPDIAMEHSS